MSIRSGRRTFATAVEADRAVDAAIATFVSNAKVSLIRFLRSSPDIPRQTGAMIESAVDNVLKTALSPNFILDIFFDVDYSDEVQERTGFIGKIVGFIQQIIKDELTRAFATHGFEAVVTS